MMKKNGLSVCIGVLVLLVCSCIALLHQKRSIRTIRQIDDGVPSRRRTRTNETADNAPLFVLHVGPPKTGTTTIQHCARDTQGLLRKDNFYYLGTMNLPKTNNFHDMVRYCREGHERDCKNKWDELKSMVEEHRKQGHNLFMSEEMLNVCGHPDEEQEHLWDNLILMLQGWRIRIAFTYRHFYGWVPSRYSQAYNPHITNRTRVKKLNWPDNGGQIIDTFEGFFDKLIKRTFIFPQSVRRRWSERFSDVQVFNLENTTNLARDFMCQMIPEAEQLCRYLESPEFIPEILNPSSRRVRHFDMLAVEAYQRGWVDHSLSRRDVTEAAGIHAPSIGYSETADFPWECLAPDKTETLFQQSLEYAKESFPKDFSSPRGEHELRSKFEEAVKAGKLCSVDINETLKDLKWKKFFKSLTRDNIRPETSS